MTQVKNFHILCILNIGTVPMLYISYVGTVPTLCILDVGTVPMLCILNIGTVPTFSSSLKIWWLRKSSHMVIWLHRVLANIYILEIFLNSKT